MHYQSILTTLLVGSSYALAVSRSTPVTTLTVFFSVLKTAQAAYTLVHDHSGDAFFRNFDFFTDPDPTNGDVKFESMADADATGIAKLIDDGTATQAVYLGVDTESQAPEGRGSVRVQSKQSYQHALVIADIAHMPGGVCGTWPAFWMVGDNWPDNGEIDMLEGVNDQTTAQMTLHTNAGAIISEDQQDQQQTTTSGSSTFTGSILTTNCDVHATDQLPNAGCAIEDSTGFSFGTNFNTNRGGIIATEWTPTSIKIWIFPRGQFPSDITSSQPNPSLEHWGLPTSSFEGSFSVDEHFQNLRIVFDTTFCGDWAGNAWNDPGSNCASLAPTCEEYVANNPGAFKEAYWAINSLQVFQDLKVSTRGDGGDPPQSTPTPRRTRRTRRGGGAVLPVEQ